MKYGVDDDPTEGKIFKIKYDELLFAEANANNSKIVTTQQTIVSGLTFTRLEEMVQASIFLRVHRSFVVNKSGIRYVQGNIVMIASKEIPIGSNYKTAFLKELGF
ncbi:MAG: LytTR family DNA-binding domain-containing protein [Chitinophagaceae bacterium]